MLTEMFNTTNLTHSRISKHTDWKYHVEHLLSICIHFWLVIVTTMEYILGQWMAQFVLIFS